MKKKLLFIVVILIISVFEIQVRPRPVQAQTFYIDKSIPRDVKSWTERIDGMTYRIFANGNSIYVINVTKEQLEIEKLKLEIRKLR